MKTILILFMTYIMCATGLQAQEMLTINDFSDGIVNNVDPIYISPKAVQDARNGYFDEDSIFKKRKGMVQYNSTAIGGGDIVLNQYEYRKSDGSIYHIAHASTTLYKRTSGTEFASFQTGISSTSSMNYAVFLDVLAYCNGIINLKAYDGTTVSEHDTTYQPKYLISWKNRLWQAGDTDEPTYVRSCGFENPGDWVATVYESTSPVSWNINAQDGQDVTGFFLSPNGNLGILKQKSVWEMAGNDKDDFYLRLVISDVGCVDSGSIVTRNNIVYWLSERGYVSYNGQNYTIVSDNIYYTIDSIQQLNSRSGTLIKDSQENWETYTSTHQIDTTSKIGALLNDYYSPESSNADLTHSVSIIQDSTGKFQLLHGNASLMYNPYYLASNLYNTTNLAANPVSNQSYNFKNNFVIDSNDIKYILYYQYNTVSLKWDLNFSSATATVWTSSEVVTGVINNIARANCAIDVDTSDYPTIVYSSQTDYGINNYWLSVSSYNGTNWNEFTIQPDLGDYIVSDIKIDSSDNVHIVFLKLYGGTYSIVYSSYVQNSGTIFNHTVLSGTGLNQNSLVDMELDTSDVPHIAFTINERMYVTNTTWNFTTLLNDGTGNIINLAIDIDSSDNIGIFYSGTTQSRFYAYRDGVWIDHLDDRLYDDNIKLDFCYDDNDNPIGVVVSGNNTLDIYTSSGTYVSEIYDTSYSTISFSTFITEETDNDYTVTHYVRSAQASGDVAAESWTEVSPGSVPGTQAYRHIQYKCIISSNVLSSVPANVNKVLINYISTGSNKKLTSMYYDDRLWLGVSVDSTTVLDKILIYDSANAWTIFSSEIPCTSLLNLNGVPYMGSDNGYIYELDVGDNDAGRDIDAYVITKDYMMGNLIQEKSINKIFVSVLESGNWNLNFDYNYDKSTIYENTYTIDLDQTSNLINYKIPFKQRKRFYTLRYKIYNSNADEPFDLLGITTYHERYPVR